MKILNKLSPHQQLVLARYIDGNTGTQYCETADGIIAGLERANIVWKCPDGSIDNWPHNIEPWARDYLDKNGHLPGPYHSGSPQQKPVVTPPSPKA